ncbi:hypothetical protein M9H77_01814 [Catharanthus roseus]|uniref:Uncharacterized protein n=1 Tax=Catharanthus roseus TaxID=4058 RepID=A0ACC0C6M3_CATRO|nr:hypothetical protein M9H77_01814 [Catharanthus roseus]
MEEVPAHGQHEHRSGLIWSRDRETCYTDLQCRRFGRNLFQCYSAAPRRLALFWLQSEEGTIGSMDPESVHQQLCTADLGGARQIGGALVLVQIWVRSLIPTLRPQLMTEIMADPLAPLGVIWCTAFDCSQLPTHTLYIRWYTAITQVYIGNPANRDTRAHGYQSVGVDRRMMEVDDMASVVIREPPSSPSQMDAAIKKVQTIIRRCMPSRRRPREHVPDRGARGVKRGARRHPGRGAGTGRPPVPPAPQRQEHVDLGPAVVEKGEGSGSGQQYVDPFDSPHLDMQSYSLGLTLDPRFLPSGSETC